MNSTTTFEPAAQLLNLLLLENVQKTEDKTTAQCPACSETGHDTEGNHLVIYPDGKFGCACHQGSDGHAHRQRIYELVGKDKTDRPVSTCAPSAKKSKGRTFEDLATALQTCCPAGGNFVKVYLYPKGTQPFAAVARYSVGQHKTFRQFHHNGTAWVSGGPDGQWPLYGVDRLNSDGPVFVVEGEKCREAAAAAGLTVVTSAGGAAAAHKTDWSPLAGRDIVILPDNDDAGVKYAENVGQLAVALTPPARVRIVQLPVKEPGADIFNFLQSGGTVTAIQALVAEAKPWEPPYLDTCCTDEAATGEIRFQLQSILQRSNLTVTEKYRTCAQTAVEWMHSHGRVCIQRERHEYTYVSYFDSTCKMLLPVQSDRFSAWLSNTLAICRGEPVFTYISKEIETEGLSERATAIDPATFWVATPSAIYLSNGPTQMVRITAGHVDLVDNGTDNIMFPCGSTLPVWKLTEPVDPFEACALFRTASTKNGHGRELTRLWACSLPSDQRTKPPLVLSGTVGGGKTQIAAGIFKLYGIPPRIAAVKKDGEGDFWVALDAGGLVCFDNVDTRFDWLPDALASASTGATQEKRKLYKDTDVVSLRARSWVCVTSASPTFAADAGLADRLLVVRLDRREGATEETALLDEIALHRDAGLSWIAQTLSRALADSDPVPTGLNSRHPDFAARAVRIGRAIGRGDAAIAALRAAENDKGLFNIENDAIGSALMDLLLMQPFDGDAATLLQDLRKIDPSIEPTFSTKQLSKRLTKLWPHLGSVFGATFTENGHDKKKVYHFKPMPKAGI